MVLAGQPGHEICAFSGYVSLLLIFLSALPKSYLNKYVSKAKHIISIKVGVILKGPDY